MTARPQTSEIEYPDSDGQPMADNTLQFQWIVTVTGNIDGLFADDPNVFVAGDLLWYAVEGQPQTRTAPDMLVAFGRPKGYRGSYIQWRENNVAPQVVWEILSTGNRRAELNRKFTFYDRYGVEEYYIDDPDNVRLQGWRRVAGRLQPIPHMDGWVSPRLGVRFDMSGNELVLYRPDGGRFLTFLELMDQKDKATKMAELYRCLAEEEKERVRKEKERVKKEKERADQAEAARAKAQRLLDQERRKAERLAERLRELGLDPKE